MRIAHDNLKIFSKEALGRRRQGTDPEPPEWLEGYLRNVFEPTPEDFRRLKRHVKKWRKIYENNYRDLRHKIFAHKEVSEKEQTDALFSKTNIRELQRMLSFLRSFHEALWQLFNNGRKPVLRPNRYSVKQMRDIPTLAPKSKAIQEQIIHEAENFLKYMSR